VLVAVFLMTRLSAARGSRVVVTVVGLGVIIAVAVAIAALVRSSSSASLGTVSPSLDRPRSARLGDPGGLPGSARPLRRRDVLGVIDPHQPMQGGAALDLDLRRPAPDSQKSLPRSEIRIR